MVLQIMSKVETGQVSQSTAEQAALTAATNSHKNNDTIIFAIGLGKDVNAKFPPTISNLNRRPILLPAIFSKSQ